MGDIRIEWPAPYRVELRLSKMRSRADAVRYLRTTLRDYRASPEVTKEIVCELEAITLDYFDDGGGPPPPHPGRVSSARAAGSSGGGWGKVVVASTVSAWLVENQDNIIKLIERLAALVSGQSSLRDLPRDEPPTRIIMALSERALDKLEPLVSASEPDAAKIEKVVISDLASREVPPTPALV